MTVTNLIPCSLVMTIQECFYCNKRDDNNITIVQVDRLFGIKTCSEHIVNAICDCKAYMHSKKMVHVKDALMNQDFKKFCEQLGDNIEIIRSSGIKDDSWEIVKVDYEHIPSLINIKGDWCIQIEKVTNDYDKTVKYFPISSFLNPDLKYAKIIGFENLVNKVINTLDDGMYKVFFNMQSEPSTYKTTIPGMTNTIISGREVKVFVP